MLATIGLKDSLGSSDELTEADTRPNAAVCYCPVLSLRDNGTVPGFFNDAARVMVGGDANEKADVVRQASPLDRITGGEPPFLFLHGDGDELVRPSHSTEMHRILLESGNASRLVIVPGAPHGFGYGVETVHQKTALKHVELFLESYLTDAKGGG